MTHDVSLRKMKLVPILMMLSVSIGAQEVNVGNPSFEEGENVPVGWTLSGGDGEWRADEAFAGKHSVSVTGNGNDMNFWRSGTIAFEPSTAYRLRFRAKRIGGGGGCLVSGPVFCSRDSRGASAVEWQLFSSVFMTPATMDAGQSWLRFGQWHATATYAFDDVRLERVIPVYRHVDGLELGEGECVKGNVYSFAAPHDLESRNHSRPLQNFRANFNTQRWVFSQDSYVIYRHRMGNRHQKAATVTAGISWYKGGELIMEISRDGKAWREIGRKAATADLKATIPADMFPAEELWVRLRSQASARLSELDDPGSFQVRTYSYDAVIDGAPVEATGATRFLALRKNDPALEVTVEDMGHCLPGSKNMFSTRIVNKTAEPIFAVPRIDVVQEGVIAVSTNTAVTLVPGEQSLDCPYTVSSGGNALVRFSLAPDRYMVEAETYIPDLYNPTYGEALERTKDSIVWWASSGWKVSETREAPSREGQSMVIRAARNEVEAVQLVVRPVRELKNFTATAGGLTGKSGVINASAIDILRVAYVSVEFPSDEAGAVDQWPDPLPPIHKPLTLTAGKNHPLWVRVHIPKGTPAGDYRGVITCTAEGFSSTVPLIVHVYDFDFPDTVSCESAFGLNVNGLVKYHHLTTEAQRREVFSKYLRNFAEHHVSPYDPTPFDPIKVTWQSAQGVRTNGVRWEGGTLDTSVKHSGGSSLMLKDESETQNMTVQYPEDIPVDKKGFEVRFWFKTATSGQKFVLTLNHFDGARRWMSGKNNNMIIEGNGEWQLFEKTITNFPFNAVSFRMYLMPTLWQSKAYTGTVWIDDMSVINRSVNREVLGADAAQFEYGEEAAPKPVFDWRAWDKAMEYAFKEFHFTSFHLPVQGMGGGSFFSHREPTLCGYAENTLQYKEAFHAYITEIESHLKKMGWLDKAYVYWFDEPGSKDYPFVMNGFNKLKENAPGLRRMITKEVDKGLVGGPNLWCPVVPSYDPEPSEERRKAGDQFWWYLCNVPQAPYCTLFIDHAGVEMRTWLWQTWERGIGGVLVWDSVNWTSNAAYPDPMNPQNPYEDPMAWVVGYGVQKNSRQPWGNGAGRFLYPPESTVYDRSGAPVLDGPVDSIRWEMLRDGIEDYEYLVMLKRLLKEKGGKLDSAEQKTFNALLEVPTMITRSATSFSKDPAPIEARRDEIAKAIERLVNL